MGIIVPATIIGIIWTIMVHHFATQTTNRSHQLTFCFLFSVMRHYRTNVTDLTCVTLVSEDTY